MIPSSPVVPGEQLEEVVYGKGQDEYLPLPAVRTEDGTVLTRWKCSWIERLQVLFIGNIYQYQMTFNDPLQPIKLTTNKPQITR
jgi:hypothetical protein